MKNRPLRDEDLALPLDVESTRWKSISFGVIRFGCLFVLMLGVLASFTPMREVAIATGEITSEDPPVIVEHIDGGIVHAIHVRDGDVVRPGMNLITLVGTRARSELSVIDVRRAFLILQKERLSALLAGNVPNFERWLKSHPDLVRGQIALFEAEAMALKSEVAAIEAEIRERTAERDAAELDIASISKRIANADEQYQIHKKLFDKGLTTRERLLDHSSRLEKERSEFANAQMGASAAERAVGEANHRLASIKSKRVEEWTNKIAEISAKIAETDEAEKDVNAKVDRLVLTATRHGIVHEMSINSVGEVISPGEHIAQILPTSTATIASLKVAPSDIGHISVGSRVEMSVTTFDKQIKGALTGHVKKISATTFEGRDGEPHYTVSVAITASSKPGSKILGDLLPGMVVHGEIITGEKSIMRYLLKPISRVFSEAFSER